MKIYNNQPPVSTVQNTQVLKNSSTVKSAPSFKGKVGDFFTLDRPGPMSRNLFIGNAFAFLLGTRLATSRDKEEVREVAIRDVPTIVIAVVGVPMLGAALAKGIQSKSGVALLVDGKPRNFIQQKFDKLFKRVDVKNKEAASYEQLKDWYVYNDKYDEASGFKGFTERLNNLGCDVKKSYSRLNSSIAERLKSVSSGKDNKSFMAELFDPKNNHSGLIQDIKTALKDEKNSLYKTATNMSTWTRIFGYGATLGLVGLMIPNLNIWITEQLHKNDKVKTNPKSNNEKVA